MIIELRGVEFVNKGAELMLYSILSKLRKDLPEAEFAMEISSRAPEDKLRELNIMRKAKGRKQALLLYMMPKVLRQRLGKVLEKDVDVIMDGSGFAFGDKWGAKKAGVRLADHITKWKSAGKKIYVLPQALGPFSDHALSKKMRVILDNADLVIARDHISKKFISEIKPSAKNIRLAPDFTNLVDAIHDEKYKSLDGQVAIIPNFKMVEGKAVGDRENYFEFLRKSIEIVQKGGLQAFFLLHEGKDDEDIALQVNTKLQVGLPIIKESHPLKVKGIIGKSRGIVSSRFHGLVSALSQGVPCVATGWSHKYEMLLEDYDFRDGLADINIDETLLKEKLKYLINPEENTILVAKLKTRAEVLKLKSVSMWAEVIEDIRKKNV
ncbi:polysaccharide pyruvyl transferase family protein [Pontibacter chinhatensis]|uniref:Colanic acid/amylovoran biosynthesis protein n=1 Tax=Pontibacter chinhatensis TaxID=1436961 RepID=A0A1I2QZP1_9BACT|nr:polysaccharide pyruvyl transferase family protein [Pontibacter chinhatensis]SFG33213.1 colanic acid/amylovoran biosynthesis protein [Pontibacter chinhatensis]